MQEQGMRNWFNAGGADYARYRPQYPAELAAFLTQMALGRDLALDVGCGSGQLTGQLAAGFSRVLGLDPSIDQLRHASGPANVDYLQANAEYLPVTDASVDLITAAQAAHWFDLPAFYAQVQRVAKPQALLALISYGVLQLEAGLNECFAHFYTQQIGAYWPPERQLVDSGYATLEFPFSELRAPAFAIELNWDLPALLGYIATWSAVRQAREAGRDQMLAEFAEQMARLWGQPAQVRRLYWPINMRIGRLP